MREECGQEHERKGSHTTSRSYKSVVREKISLPNYTLNSSEEHPHENGHQTVSVTLRHKPQCLGEAMGLGFRVKGFSPRMDPII